MTASAPEVEAWLVRAGGHIERGELADAAQVAAEALGQYPEAAALWNLRGVIDVAAGRVAKGIASLGRAAELDSSDPEPLRNLMGLHLLRQSWDDARGVGWRLLALTPRDPEAHRMLGAAAAGKQAFAIAAGRFRVSVRLDPGRVQAWLDLISVLGTDRPSDAVEAVEQALAANPDDHRLAALRLELMAVAEVDEAAGAGDLAATRRRLDLAMQRLADGPKRGWSVGRSEGLELQAAHDALLIALDAGVPPELLPWAAGPLLMRLLAWDALERVESFKAVDGDPRNLLMQIARVRTTLAARLELLAQHRLWAARAEAVAARAPVVLQDRVRAGRIRLGFKSSDLGIHVVGAFAWPLFEHLDRDRFDVYIYSLAQGSGDATEEAIAERVTAFRRLAGADPRSVAETIAADGLDMLIEIGGLTGANKPEVMAYRMAPIQASWMGYPHSLGLSTIDHIILDPQLAPSDPALLLEKPLLMPRSWVVMGEHFFREEPRPSSAPPSVGAGCITFGTANATYKYSKACMTLWARVLAAVPGSRFLFVRPETGAPSFRRRALAVFAAHGVEPERIRFEAVRGGHLPFYDQIDIALDTLPLTGGTTTCESLWMGVPVVSLVGEAIYERLSYSLLANVGLGDLAVGDADAYVDAAVRLAADPARLAALRSGLRERIRTGPLGDLEGFAKDFYDLVAQTVTAIRSA